MLINLILQVCFNTYNNNNKLVILFDYYLAISLAMSYNIINMYVYSQVGVSLEVLIYMHVHCDKHPIHGIDVW